MQLNIYNNKIKNVNSILVSFKTVCKNTLITHFFGKGFGLFSKTQHKQAELVHLKYASM